MQVVIAGRAVEGEESSMHWMKFTVPHVTAAMHVTNKASQIVLHLLLKCRRSDNSKPKGITLTAIQLCDARCKWTRATVGMVVDDDADDCGRMTIV